MKSGAALRLDPFSPDDPEGVTPESFLEEIHAALNAGSLAGARDAAERGLARFPHHAELQRLHWVLRPGEVRKVPGSRMPDPRPSYEWLRRNASQYRGQWVALGGGELIAASEDFGEVYEASRESRKHTDFIHFID
jgi:hypothetical protein